MRSPSGSRLPLLAWLAASGVAHGTALFVALGGMGHWSPLAVKPPPAADRNATIGDTFEIPTDELTESPEEPPASAADPAEAAPTPPTPLGSRPEGAGLAPSPVAAHARAARPSTVAAAATSGASAGREGGSAALFGAVGERGAAQLAAAFTHGFPQAASADPLWLTAPFGSAGTVDVDLTLDDQGALVSVRREGGSPGPALAEGLRRTLALIRARSFVAEGRVTRLRLSATVSPDQVHDGLHGDVFAIGGGFEAGEGSAFFALAVGRRVDIRVRVLR